MTKYKYEIGQLVETKNGKLEYLGQSEEKYGKTYLGKWKCYCGKEFFTINYMVMNENTKSCGCYYENKVRNPEIAYLRIIHKDIKQRCYNENNQSFHNYGGRGIIIDPIWKDNSKKFIEDILSAIGHRPTEKHQLDRIDNNGNYTINNLRWVTPKENCRNTRRIRLIVINGEEKTVTEWSEISKISKSTLSVRINNGWTEEKILQPVKKTAKFKNLPILYTRWISIKQRCYGFNCKAFYNYGGRGITIFDLWKNNYKKFEKDLIKEIGLPPTKKHQLDRIDNNSNYIPGNLRWATAKENGRNTRKNILFTINGEEKTISEWSEKSGLSFNTILKRIKKNWSNDKILAPITISKLDKNQVEKIKNDLKNISVIALAKLYNVSKDTIINIKYKRGAYAN